MDRLYSDHVYLLLWLYVPFYLFSVDELPVHVQLVGRGHPHTAQAALCLDYYFGSVSDCAARQRLRQRWPDSQSGPQH